MRWRIWLTHCIMRPKVTGSKSLGFFIHLILRAIIWPWDRRGLKQKWESGVPPGRKSGLTTLPGNSGNLNLLDSWRLLQACTRIAAVLLRFSKGKDEAIPVYAWTDPDSSWKLRLPDFMTIGTWSLKVVSPIHRPPLRPADTTGPHFCSRLSRPHNHSAAGRIMSIKNSNDTIGYRNLDLPVFSAVPQPTALLQQMLIRFRGITSHNCSALTTC